MKIGERIEWLCSQPLAFWVFTIAFIVGARINIDATNIAISYFTAAMLLLTLGAQRRNNMAIHAKLDDLECSISEADSDMARLEEKPESDIKAKRK